MSLLWCNHPCGSQALFRPVSMCIPDLALICEIMLMAEGFQQSKVWCFT